MILYLFFFFFSSRRRHTRCSRDWSSDVCSSDLDRGERAGRGKEGRNETADRDEGRKAVWIPIREVPHPIAAHGQACEIHAVRVDLELSAHLVERGDGDRKSVV